MIPGSEVCRKSIANERHINKLPLTLRRYSILILFLHRSSTLLLNFPISQFLNSSIERLKPIERCLTFENGS